MKILLAIIKYPKVKNNMVRRYLLLRSFIICKYIRIVIITFIRKNLEGIMTNPVNLRKNK